MQRPTGIDETIVIVCVNGTGWANIAGTQHRIGSNTALVAPVKVGDHAMTASGSVITKDVASGALALSRAPQTEKVGWADAFRATKAKKPSK